MMGLAAIKKVDTKPNHNMVGCPASGMRDVTIKICRLNLTCDVVNR